MAEEPRTRIEHPNRRKASSRATRLVVVVLLLVSIALTLIVTVAGWNELAGAQPVQVGYMVVYLLLAVFVLRWSRGVLPLISALAVGLLIFAAVAVPGWYARDKTGFAEVGLPADVLGLVCALLVPVQLLLIAVAMSGFRQAWNVEVERPVDEDEPGPPMRKRGSGPSPAPA